MLLPSHRPATAAAGIALLTLAVTGCGPFDPAAVGKKGGNVPAVLQMLDTPEQQALDQLNWLRRANELLPKVTDEKSADAHASALAALVRDKEQLNARAKNNDWSKEVRDSLNAKYGDERKKLIHRYGEVARPFEITSRTKLNEYIVSRYGIDIRRMKTIKK